MTTGNDDLVGSGYRTLGLVGEGGLARVFAAQDLETGEVVAVKVLHERLRTNQTALARFRHEAEILAALQEPPNPYIVRFRTSGQTPLGVPFLVMELLQGHTLAEELDRCGPLPVLEVVSLLRQALSATAHAHRLGLVHRDLKPQNLFLHEEQGRRVVKVLDYGVAKFLGSSSGRIPASPTLTAEGDFIGTARFTSAEAAMQQPVDLRSDVYLLGNVLATLLTSRVPFDHIDSPEDVLVAHAMLDPAAPSTYADVPVPAELDRIVLKAVAKDPDDRFQTAEEFDAAIAQVEESLRRPQGWMDTVAFDGSRLAGAVREPAEYLASQPDTGEGSNPGCQEECDTTQSGSGRGTGEDTRPPQPAVANSTSTDPGSRRTIRVGAALGLFAITVLVATACIILLLAGTSAP